jgi:hypothetical protein
VRLKSCSIKVLALVFVRKLMDYFFTQKELYYLDDIMPAIRKKAKSENKKGNHSTENLKSSEIGSIDITHELSKTNIWKNIVNNNSTNDMLNKNRTDKQIMNTLHENDVTFPLIKKSNE